MKAVTIFKWAMNPADQKAGPDGSVSWAAKRPDVGDDDHAAVAMAVAAADGGEVVGMTTANGDTAFAAARGAARTIALDGLEIESQPAQIARALANAVKAEGDVDVVTIGDSVWNPMVPSMLAGLLGWQAISAVDEVKPADGGLTVTRRFGTGTQDIAVSGPVVLAVSARREEENKPGMRVVLQARKKPVDTVAAEGMAEAAAYQVKGNRKPDAVASKIFDATADLDGAVAQLVQAMQMEGVL